MTGWLFGTVGSIRFRMLCFRALVIFGTGFLMNLSFASKSMAQVGDRFEGAVWRFHISPKGSRREPVTGLFRVADHELFQKESRDDESKERLVGRNHPDGRKTRMVFKELLVFEKGKTDSDRPRPRDRVSGTALLRMDEPGEWSGRFIDSEGLHWDFRCSRIRE